MNLSLSHSFSKSIKLFIVGIMLFVGIALDAQTTYTWVGGNGAWNVPGNWSPATVPPSSNTNTIIEFSDGGTYTVNTVPSTVARQFIVRNNSNVTLQATGASLTLSLSATVAGTNFVIEAGSTLSNLATNPYSIAIGATSSQLSDISGTLNWNGGTITFPNTGTAAATVSSSGIINHFAGTITTGAATRLVFSSGGTYNYLGTGALTIPLSTWDAASNVNITGLTTAVTVLGMAQSFGNFTYNCASQGTVLTSLGITSTTTRFKGSFTLQSTGSTGAVSFKNGTAATTLITDGTFNVNGGTLNANIAATAGLTLTLNGNYQQSGGTMNVSTAAIGCSMTVAGSFTQTAGTFILTTQATACTMAVTGNHTLSGSSIYRISSGASASTYTLTGNLDLSGSATFDLSSSTAITTFNLDGNYIQTGGTFTKSGATSVSTFNLRGVNKTYEQTSGTVTNTLINYAIVSPGSLTLNSNITTAASRTFVINSGATLTLGSGTLASAAATGGLITNSGTLYCGTNIIGGSGGFTNTNALTTFLHIGSQTGIATTGATGNIQVTGTRSFGVNSHYIYYGLTGQITGAALAVNITGSITVNLSDGGTLTLTNSGASTISTAGRLRMINGSLTNAASFGASNTTLEYAGTSAQTTANNDFPSTSGPVHLVINNAAGVTLHAARTLPATGVFTLTSGLFNTDATNFLTIGNTAIAAVVGGTSTSYVNGPLARTLNAVTGLYSFPVGKSVFADFDINVVTAPGSATVYKVVYTETAPSAAAGLGLASLGSTFWRTERISGSGSLTNAIFTMYESGILASSRVGYSPDNSSTAFVNIGGTGPAASITSLAQTVAADGYFTVATGGTLSGTQTAFTTLTSIANALRTMQVVGDVTFELPTSYSGEPAYPVLFNAFTTDGTDWTAKIQPASGSTSFLTAGDPGSAISLIDLNTIDRLTIDGRVSGSGSAIWTFRNTRTATTVGPTFQFINDATFNVLTYLNIEGQNITGTSGTILFSTSAGLSLGNSNNTISNCSIRENTVSGTLPINGIYSVGTASFNNANNTITTNQIFNNFAVGTSGAGIWLGINNVGWNITDNHFYQTASRTGTGAVARYGIYILNGNALSTNFNISGNYIGGSAVNAGGSALTIAGNVNHSFVGIHLSTLAAGNNLVENNVIRNITIAHGTAANTLAFVGIYDLNGNNEIKGNTIGSLTGSDLITINSNLATASSTYGIYLTSGIDTLTNNTIGGISLSSTTGIVGFTAIHSALTTSAVIINNNTIAKINAAYTGATAGGFVRGIYAVGTTTSGIRTIRYNNIYQLNSASSNTGAGATSTSSGITQLSTVAGHTISDNTIHSITNSHATAATNVVGLFYDGATSGANVIVRNNIHSLSLATSSATTATTVYGIQVNSGLVTVANNMIRLGIDSAGTSITGGYLTAGILHTSATANSVYYYNSIYVGGTGVSGTNNTFAFNRTAASGTITIRNNIFANARSNGAGTGAHYAMGIANLTGLGTPDGSNNNIFYAPGTGGMAVLNVATPNTISVWQAGGRDGLSYLSNPHFLNATGNSALVDLHLNTSIPTQTESNGFAVLGGPYGDYDTDIRFGEAGYSGGGTAPDIGADEAELIPVDLTPPLINYTAIPNQLTFTAPTLAATITDAGGVEVGSGLRPRIYFKRSTDANTFNDNTNTTDGWKFVETSSTSNTYSLPINYSLLFGGGANAGDIIQYFVIAQDNADVPNVTLNSGALTVAATSVVLTSSNFPLTGTINSYLISIISGTYNVDSSGAINSLTNTGGMFALINASALNGNVTVNITSDLLAETGTILLNQWPEVGGSGYTVTIQSNNTTPKTIRTASGQGGSGLIRYNGADRVTVSGGTGTQRLLIFQNTSAASGASTFSFVADASNNTITDCVIEGSAVSTGNGVISFGTGTSTGNDDNTISNCDIRDYNSALPTNGIYSVGSSVSIVNNNNSISNCNISNYFNASSTTSYAGINIGSFSSGWSITDNKFFQTATRTITGAVAPFSAIYINNTVGVGFTITGNQISGSAADGSGTMTYTSATSPQFSVIHLLIGASPQSLVENNTIKNIAFTTISGGTANQGTFSAIYLGSAGSAIIKGNTIGSTSTTGNIALTLNTNAGGIANAIKSDALGAVRIENNTIGGISFVGAGTNVGNTLYGVHFTAASGTGSVVVKGNTIGGSAVTNSMQTSGTATTNASIVGGIYGNVTRTSIDSILGNQISNLTNSQTGTASRVFGIYGGFTTTAGRYIINDNIVRNLTTTATNTGTGLSASVLGIGLSTTVATELSLSRNTIHSISNTSAANAQVLGICFSGGASASNTIEQNFVHSITPSTGASSTLTGIQVLAGAGSLRNNMVRMGLTPLGGNIIQAVLMYGIELTSTSAFNVFHNSVYMGGAVSISSSINTSAFRRTAASGTHNIQNNIFSTARTQSGVGRNYTISLSNITGVTSNYNILYSTGTGTSTGMLGAGDYPSLQDWRTATTNRDLNSLDCNPAFINPIGDITDIDLHLNTLTGTAAEGRGNPAALSPAVTLDYDGETRDTPALNTVDVGADAGEYIALSGPTLAPLANAEDTLATCAGNAVTFTANATGGSTCAHWQYSWYNGSQYWNGSSFASATEMFDTTWHTINVSSIATGGTFTVKANCYADYDNCISTTQGTVIITLQTSPASLTAAIGNPANGLNHNLVITWATASGATSYQLEYSTDNTSWNALYSGTNLTYTHNTGDAPNAPYYYRVRSVFASENCSWTNATQFPIYTAADAPALLTLDNATSYTIDVTLQAETPVANPSITTYSIRNATTNQFVQANGSLGATEIFQTMSVWSTITVTGLAPNTEYCFYARAKNNDGDIREGVGSNIVPAEAFTTNANFDTSVGAPTNKFWSPASCTTGGLVYNASGGCSGGYVGKSGTFTGFFGCFLRTPAFNCTGNSSVKIFFDVSNSYFASQPLDRIRFYMFADGEYKSGACTSVKVDGVEVSTTDINGRYLPFSVSRTCKNIEVTFNLSTTTNKSNVLFYLEPSNGYNNSNLFSVVIDNVSLFEGTPTACLSTAPLVLNGDYTIGSGGTYPSLTNAGGFFEAVNMATLSGNVTATVISNLSSESGIFALNQWVESGAGNYTITLRPSDNTNRVIEGSYVGADATVAGLFRMNGADRLIVDGRDPANLGAGGKHLLFRNQSATSSAFNSTFNFLNDATNDTIRYSIIEGSTISTTNGVIRISTAGSGNGNDFITINNNQIRDRSNLTAYPVNGIFALGTLNKDNNDIVISDNEIFNMWSTSSSTNGILVSTYNSGWSISGNSIYQTTTRTAGTAGSTHMGIQVSNISSTAAFAVDGNYIGGTQAQAAGSAWTQNGTINSTFIGIQVDANTGSSNTIQNNIVANINWTCGNNATVSRPGIFTGIYVINGGYNILNNTIGNSTGTGSITVTTTASNATTFGIAHGGSSGTMNISGNKIGSITTVGSSSTINHNFSGIAFGQGGSSSIRTISNNIIGSKTTTNSINASTSASGTTSTASQRVVGIDMTVGANDAIITGNTIANLNNNYIGSYLAAQTIGISSPFATNTIANDTIYNLTSSGALTGTGAGASVIGITLFATSANAHSISKNVVYNLRSTAASAATSIVGIYYGSSTGTTNRLTRNFVHSLSSSSTANSIITGLYMGAGSVTADNNMIHLGIDGNGSSITSSHTFQGIAKDNTSSNNLVYFNSVYIGGSGVGSSSNPTYAFRRIQTGASDNVRNNIFVNARSNASTGGKHYGVYLNNSTTLTMSYNQIYTTGTGSVFGSINTVDYANLLLWNATGFGTGSISLDPLFIDATSATPNLHLTAGSSGGSESAGIVIAGVTDDFDALNIRTGYPLGGQTYGGGTAPDLGADETDMIPVDASAPSFSYTNIGTQTAACSPILTSVNVTIIDGQSGISLSNNLPRMYFRRKVGSPTTTWSFTNSVEGTYVSGSVNNSVWNFELDYSAFGITAASGDQFEYYFVAQDQATIFNVGTSQSNGTEPVHSDVATITTPASYALPASGLYTFGGTPLSGTVYIDQSSTGGDVAGVNWFTSLTKFDGLFSAINANGLSGNLTVIVRGATIAEDGNQTLNTIANYCGSGYTVHISPSSASVKTLTGSLSGMGLFGIYASNVTIDGRFAESGRYLKFENTYSSTGGSENSVFRFGISGAVTNDTLRYCEVVGNGTKLAGAVVHLASVNSFALENNILHGGTWATNIVRADNGSNVTISSNEIYNFGLTTGGITTRSYGLFVNTGNGSNWTITDNSFYNQANNTGNVQTAISFIPGVASTGNTISNNWIGGSAAEASACSSCGINMWRNGYVNTGSLVEIVGITANAGQVEITQNVIKRIWLSSVNYSGIVGIQIIGNTLAQIEENTMGGTFASDYLTNPSSSDIIETDGGSNGATLLPGYVYGITTTSSNTVTIDSNVFNYMIQNGAVAGGAVICIMNQGAAACVITNNTNVDYHQESWGIYGWHSDAIFFEPTTSTSGNIISGNNLSTPRINGAGTAQVSSNGIFINILGSRTVSGTISSNRIVDNPNVENSGFIEGLFITTNNGNTSSNGTWNIHNNMIYLSNPGETLIRTEIEGMDIQLNSSSTANIFYNTVWVDGFNRNNTSTLANPSMALYNAAGLAGGYGTINLKNNILINTRQGGSPNSDSYHVAIWRATANSTGLSSDNNMFVYRNGTTYCRLAVYGLNAMFNLPTWQGFTSTDANTINPTWTTGASNYGSNLLNTSNLFTQALSTSDLHLNDSDGQSYLFPSNEAAVIALTTDFDGETRDSSTPDIGADEYSAPCITPVITAEPLASQQACQSASPTNLTVTATGASSYQWFSNTVNSNTGGTSLGSGSGAQTATYTPPTSSTGTMYYYVEVTGTCPSPDVSSTATVVVIAGPAITVYSPLTFVNTICEGSSTSFGITATGGGTLTYLWEVSTNSGGSWSSVPNTAPYSGITSASLSISNTPSTLNGYLYRCTVSNSCGSVTSSNGTLNVNAAPSISGQPLSTQSVCEDSTPTNLSVTASGFSLSYQWYSNATNSNTGGSSLGSGSGAQTATYTPPTNAVGTTYYYVVISSSCGSPVTSTTSEVIVATPFSILADPITTQTICQDDDASEIFVEAAGSPLTYQWFSNTSNSNSGGTSLGIGAQSPYFTPPTSSAGTLYYYAVVTGGCGSPLTSETSEVIVNSTVTPSVSITADPNSTICDGTSVTFTATPTNGGSTPSYQWKVNGNDVGTNSSTYTTTSLNNGDAVTCEITGNAPCVSSSIVASNTINITVNPQPEVYAGTDMTTCITVPITFANGASTDYTSSILWTHNGTGSLTNTGTLTPTYTAGTGETSVTFTLTGNGNGTCSPSSDIVILTITSNTYFQDGDGDGFGNPAVSVAGCTPPVGYVTNNLDFCDTNPVYNPNTQWWADVDGDGFGGFIFASGDLGGGCNNPMPGELVLIGGDCDDNNANVNPSSPDVCTNSIDDNCNGLVNENCSSVVNDQPLQATIIPLSGNSYPNCGVITGTLNGAADSPESAGFTGSDVWYKFTAVSSAVSISMSGTSQDNVLTLYNNNIVLLAGNSTENVMGAGGAEVLNYSGLTVGQLYYISAGAVSGTGGSYSLCLKHLTASYCADGSGTYQLCTNLKAAYTGATDYTFNFTPTGATGGEPTSITYSGQLPLALTAIAIRYGGTYTVRIDANYNALTNGNNQSEAPITVQGIQTCNITIAPHADMYTKETQQCPATLLRNSVVTAKPFICGATSFTVEFTKVTNCSGTTTIGFPFQVSTAGASPSRSLNFTVPEALTNQSYYRVRWRPNFSYGSGSFGIANVIFIGGAANESVNLMQQNDENTKGVQPEMLSNLYPNPNNGDVVNLNLTDVKSPDVFVRIMDAMGRVIYSNRYGVDGSLNTLVTFSKPLSAGIYLVEMTAGDEVITQRMIVER